LAAGKGDVGWPKAIDRGWISLEFAIKKSPPLLRRAVAFSGVGFVVDLLRSLLKV